MHVRPAHRLMSCCLAAAAIAAAASHAHAQCEYVWDTSIGGSQDAVYSFHTHQGSLYAGGEFFYFGGSAVGSIARFDGQKWQPLGGGLLWDFVPAKVHAMASFDPDGAGPAPSQLIAGGNFNQVDGSWVWTDNVAMWNGEAWEALGGGLPDMGDGSGWGVRSLSVMNTTNGPRLYAFGSLRLPNNSFGVAQWDGNSWEPMGQGAAQPSWVAQQTPLSSVVHNDGTGEALYVGGLFDGMVNVPGTARVAKWNGTAWSSVGGGLVDGITKLESYDPDGPGGAPAQLVAFGNARMFVWNGSSWSAPINFTSNTCGNLLTASGQFNDGTGNKLYIGMGECEGQPNRIMRYDGTTIQSVFDPLLPNNVILHISAHNIGGSDRLLIGGLIRGTASQRASRAMTIDNNQLVSAFPNDGVAEGANTATGQILRSLVAIDPDGAGPKAKSLVAMGSFGSIGNVEVRHAASFDGTQWSQFGSIIPDGVAGFLGTTVGRVNGVEKLYAIMNVADELGNTIGRVYRFDDNDWTLIGSATSSPYVIYTQAQFISTINLGGNTDQIVVTGVFNTINGVSVSNSAIWDGSAWHSIAPEHAGVNIANAVTFDHGTGATAHAVRPLPGNGAQPAFWNGTGWTDMTLDGLPSSFISPNNKLITVGDQLLLYSSTWADSQPIMFRYEGTSWYGPIAAPASYFDLVGVADLGDGERLYGAAYAMSYNNYACEGYALYSYDGVDWSEATNMGYTLGSKPTSIARFDVNGQSSLWFAGGFSGVGATTVRANDSAAGIDAFQIARWYCPEVVTPTCPGDFNNSGSVTADDIFAFLDAWFAQNGQTGPGLSADVNGSDSVTADDIFAYLDLWFANNGNTCP